MTKKRKFKEIRLKVQEIVSRKPTKEQLEDLRNTFVEIERSEKDSEHKKSTVNTPEKKIARDPELGA
ncbi:MAG: hypothetical protein JNL01_12915 [Bdellovibrionales bacterium]|nr:hypothetical protein [Bdellovibrionales bacterium]